MTRINIVPVEELCDQHLLAEHRELTRIPNCILSGRLKYHYDDAPDKYTLGKGHVKFFSNKLGFLCRRYNELHKECLRRGFNVQYHFRKLDLVNAGYEFNDWSPNEEEITINRIRITEKTPKIPRYTSKRR